MMSNASNRFGLAGQRILVTRPALQSEELSRLLGEFGAEAIVLPLLEPRPLNSLRAREEIEKIQQKQHDTLLFTSANGARFLFQEMEALEVSIAELSGVEIHALGAKTQEYLESRGCRVIYHQGVRQSEDFLAALQSHFAAALGEKRFLWPRAAEVRDVLAPGLRNLGAQLVECVVYESAQIQVSAPLPANLNWITFASPSAIDSFRKNFVTFPAVGYACIGKVSAERLKHYGVECEVIADEPSNAGLVAALNNYLCQ